MGETLRNCRDVEAYVRSCAGAMSTGAGGDEIEDELVMSVYYRAADDKVNKNKRDQFADM